MWTFARLFYIADDQLPFPIIADESRILAKKLGMIDPVEKDCKGDPVTARCVSIQHLTWYWYWEMC